MSSRGAARDERLRRRAARSDNESDRHRAGAHPDGTHPGTDPDGTRSSVAAEVGAPDH
jgi:hypothetical protein